MDLPLLASPAPGNVARWPESEKRAPPLPRPKPPLWLGLFASALVHSACLTAIFLFESGPQGTSASQAIKIDLVRKPPGMRAASPAGGPQSGSKEALLRKPPPEPPPLRKPPPEPPPQKQAADASSQAPRPPASPSGQTLANANALPFFLMPNAFAERTLSGQGQAGDAYKGIVFGMLARAERAPKPKPGETGQAIVSFSVDGRGRIVSLALVQSSGHPDLDSQALAMVRSVSPFPPPPKGAGRSFAAAIDFGLR